MNDYRSDVSPVNNSDSDSDYEFRSFESDLCPNPYPNVLFLTFDNEFSGIMYSLFGGRQTMFLTMFSNKFVVKCVAKKFKNRLTNKDFMPKINFEYGFCIGKGDNP